MWENCVRACACVHVCLCTRVLRVMHVFQKKSMPALRTFQQQGSLQPPTPPHTLATVHPNGHREPQPCVSDRATSQRGGLIGSAETHKRSKPTPGIDLQPVRYPNPAKTLNSRFKGKDPRKVPHATFLKHGPTGTPPSTPTQPLTPQISHRTFLS